MLDFQTTLLMKKQFLLSELQTRGLRLLDPSVGASSCKGGAGPTDHKAVTVLGTTIIVPVHTLMATRSPTLRRLRTTAGFRSCLKMTVSSVKFPFPHGAQGDSPELLKMRDSWPTVSRRDIPGRCRKQAGFLMNWPSVLRRGPAPAGSVDKSPRVRYQRVLHGRVTDVQSV
jgi:hypothetical protein